MTPERDATLTAQELALWDAKAYEARFTELDRVKASAAAWATFNTGLLGALGIAGVTVAPDSIGKIKPDLLSLAVALALLAIAFNIVSVCYAYRATRTATEGALNDGSTYRRYVFDESEVTRRALVNSRTATILAFTSLLGLAALTIFYSKPKPDPTNDVLVVLPSGVVCGPLAGSPAAPTVNGKPLTGATFVVAATCP